MLKAIGGLFSRLFESVGGVFGDAKRMFVGNKIKVISFVSVYFLIYAAFAYFGGVVFGFIFYLSTALYIPLVVAYVARGKEGRLGNWAWEKRAKKPKSLTGRVLGFVGDGFKTVLKPVLIVCGFIKKLFGNSPVAFAIICFWFIVFCTSIGFFSRFVPELLMPLGSVVYEQMSVVQSAVAEYPITQAWLDGVAKLNMTNFWLILPFFSIFTFFVLAISLTGFIKSLKDGGGFKAVMAYSVKRVISSMFTIIALIVIYLVVTRLVMVSFYGISLSLDLVAQWLEPLARAKADERAQEISYYLSFFQEFVLGIISMFGVLAMISVATKEKPLKVK